MENKHDSKTKSDLTSQALENLSEEQVNDLMAKLAAIKAEKEAARAKGTDKAEPGSEVLSPLISPDPACFQEDDPDATKVFSPVKEEIPPVAPLTPSAPACPAPSAALEDAPIAVTPAPAEDWQENEPAEDSSAIEEYRMLVRKRKRQRQTVIVLLVVFGAVLIAMLLFIGYLTLYRPSLDTDPPFDPVVTEPAGTESSVPGQESGPAVSDAVSAPVISDRYERKKDFYTFLILGVDRAANLSDVIMLASFDVKNESISVVSLPRDSYIDTGKNFHKINAYFSSCYNHSTKEGEERYRDAIEGMASFLERGLCVKIDRYVCMDTAGFREIVDAIGGVHMDVPFDMDYEDPEQDLFIHLKAGYQLLDGAAAEQFVRFRKAYLNGDIGRISAQKLFLTALAKEVKDKLDVQTAVSLAKATLPYVKTNLTAAELGYFAMHALGVDLAEISFTTFPGAGTTNPDSGAAYYVLYAEAVRTIVNHHLNVYTREISKEVFLANSVKFTSDEPYISNVFTADVVIDDTISAGDVAADGVDIPRR